MSVPVAANAVVSPSSFQIGDTITASYTYSGDPESGTLIRWYKNNIRQRSLDNKRSFVVSGVRGDVFYFTVTPCDGTQYGSTVVSAVGIMKNNPPPDVSWVEIIPHTPVAGVDDLKVFHEEVEDPDGDKVIYHYKWYKNGVELASYEDKTTIPYTEVSEGDVFTVEVTTTDNYEG
jgi:hypothetical protein